MVLCFTTEKQLSCLDDCNFLLLPRLGSLPIRAKYSDYVENYFLFKKKNCTLQTGPQDKAV